MYLKSLTLRGFKSFASATTLAFEPGLTAVVGPNGSGKSNLVDALSWVMGEQGVKALRGSKMDDVIFAGTSGRAPLGRAEVTLTIDNTDQVLPIDYTEVTISRTLFRNGVSEYAINGQVCRLLDVQELLSDTGMGRQMHVVVGQGQLDAILAATPDLHRGFIEEAAGVLKHRRRRDKAVRKLESTQANLVRLGDLIGEIRRQLKPLGRQAEVARRASVVQACLRDARARLLADELVHAMATLETDLAAEAVVAAERERCEAALRQAQTDEDAAEQAVALTAPRAAAAQETWYGLATLRERAATTASIAAERVRVAAQVSQAPALVRDPARVEADIAEARAEEAERRADVGAAETRLAEATRDRETAEQVRMESEQDYGRAVRANADRREGLAKLEGQINALRSRLQAGAEEDERVGARTAEARMRSAAAQADHAVLEERIAAHEAGQTELDEAFQRADGSWAGAQARLEDLRADLARVEQERAGQMARLEALELTLAGTDVAGALADRPLEGLVGRLADVLEVEAPWRGAIAAALGTAAEAIVVSDVPAALAVLEVLKAEGLGRAHLLIGGDAPVGTPAAVSGARWAATAVRAPRSAAGAVARLLAGVVLVDDLGAAQALVAERPDLTAVTREAELLSAYRVDGGGPAEASRLEVTAAAQAAREQVAALTDEGARLRDAVAQAARQTEEADRVRAAALARLDESDAALAALTTQAELVAQSVREGWAEVDRIAASSESAQGARDADRAALSALEERLVSARGDTDPSEPDPAPKNEAVVQERLSRQAELEARLALRTAEERLRAASGHAAALERAAAAERDQAAAQAARAERARAEGRIAAAVHAGAEWLIARIEAVQALAAAERAAADEARVAAEAAVTAARGAVRERTAQLDRLVEGSHRDELARMEQRLRVENLTSRALTDLGLEASALIEDYGPDQLVPVLLTPAEEAAGVPVPDPVPYVRAEQMERVRQAEADLVTLGRVNPLALEEFDAMNERHSYLAAQVDDLKRTRADLLGIIGEVDTQVQEVFSAAFADVARTFEDVFTRLFPGGHGRLVLTDPDDMLNTGVEIEARPAGKRITRLSLLSGGERSLVAVAFLLSLFIARPSPFYIMDEVEAALDDTNLSRLLAILADLRQRSQLLVITHQKRTMEIADALYGVTMRDDGVSTVVSQRLVDR